MIVADHGYINTYDYPVTVQCIVREAQRQQLEPELLWAILRKENGRVGSHSVNSNKTVDIGPMQINNGKYEVYLNDLVNKTHFSKSKFKNMLYNDACFNVSVGAYVLRMKINAAGGNMMKGAGWYHSANEPYYSRYRRDLENKYRDLKRSADIQRKIQAAKANLNVTVYKVKPTKPSKSSRKPDTSSMIAYNGPDWLKPSPSQKQVNLKLLY